MIYSIPTEIVPLSARAECSRLTRNPTVYLSPEPEFRTSSVDKLGDRLRSGSLTDADLRLLDDYRLSFRAAYESVIRVVEQELELEVTGRPAKSTTSIVEKLQRETIRLSQMQDIAGCRIVVDGLAEQEDALATLITAFDGATVIDRRDRPSHGYRAVHIVARPFSKSIEIQLRTSLQHQWAEVSEKLADTLDPAIKYGGGGASVRQRLDSFSDLNAAIEMNEQSLNRLRARVRGLKVDESFLVDLAVAEKDVALSKQNAFRYLSELGQMTLRNDAIPD